MECTPEPSADEMMDTVAMARILLGEDMNLQVPPNLSAKDSTYLRYLKAGINDWGGISPVTMDYVNPEAPWPHIDELRCGVQAEGFQLRARFPVYPEYILGKNGYLSDHLLKRLRSDADEHGYVGGQILPFPFCERGI